MADQRKAGFTSPSQAKKEKKESMRPAKLIIDISRGNGIYHFAITVLGDKDRPLEDLQGVCLEYVFMLFST